MPTTPEVLEVAKGALLKRFLNVGGADKSIAVSAHFSGWKHDLLDIDPVGNPDIVCDAREMHGLEAKAYDAVYCSHNLEHFAPHDVPRVLAGFRHVLRDEGFVEIRVPDVRAVIGQMFIAGHDLEDVHYTSMAGPITYRDTLYGYAPKVAEHDYWGHKTAFSVKTLRQALANAGFGYTVPLKPRNWEIALAGFALEPGHEVRELLGLGSGAKAPA